MKSDTHYNLIYARHNKGNESWLPKLTFREIRIPMDGINDEEVVIV